MKSTTAIISEDQSILLTKTADYVINGADFNYGGYTLGEALTTADQFVLYKNDAIRNRILFWLGTFPGDYIRQPSKGGPLYSMLGKTLTESNAQQLEATIRNQFTENFTDVSLENVIVTPNIQAKRWDVSIVVFDLITREAFIVDVGVST
jgi:hypothetical protein